MTARRRPQKARAVAKPQTSAAQVPTGTVPLVSDSDVFWFDVSFFIEKTRASQTLIAAIAKAMATPMPRGKQTHVLEGVFGSTRQGPFVRAHIDQTKLDDEMAYYVMLHIHGDNVQVHDHEDASDSRPASVLYKHLAELGKDGPVLGFFDAHLETDWPAPTQSTGSLPITIGGRMLPVVGASYGADLDRDGVYSFRWAKSDGGIAVDVSYSIGLDLALLPELSQREHANVASYVKEALPR